MTTTTKTKTMKTRRDSRRVDKDPAPELAKLEAAAAEAQAKVGDTRHRLRLQQAHRQQLDAELARLGQQEPAEFDPDGHPRGERAKKLTKDLAEVSASRLGDVLAGVEDRALEARHAVDRYIGEHVEEMARHEFEGAGRAAVGLFEQARELIEQAQAEYTASEQRLWRICQAAPGLSVQDVVSDVRAADFSKAAKRLTDLQPPRARSLTPLEGEVPPCLKTKAGGYVGHANADDIAGVEQPRRVMPV